EIDHEIRDVLPSSADTLYMFLGEKKRMPKDKITALIESKTKNEHEATAVWTLLLWHAVLGYQRTSNEDAFIYDVNYDIKRLQGLIDKHPNGNPTMVVNPAFWPGLEMS
ncbi:MAG: hypothetical protein WA138_00390, partial [Parvibaculum sp.]